MSVQEILNVVNEQAFAIWFLIGAALVFFMQAGFAMVETGFTRAKNAVIILGSMGMVYEMIDNEDEQKRYTSLCDRIIESR